MNFVTRTWRSRSLAAAAHFNLPSIAMRARDPNQIKDLLNRTSVCGAKERGKRRPKYQCAKEKRKEEEMKGHCCAGLSGAAWIESPCRLFLVSNGVRESSLARLVGSHIPHEQRLIVSPSRQ